MQFKLDQNDHIIVEFTSFELITITDIASSIRNSKADLAIQSLFNIKDTEKIICFAENNLLISKLCKHEKMAEFWQEVWKLLSRFPTWQESQEKNLPYRALIPQDNISCFELVRGMYFYIKGNVNSDNAEENKKLSHAFLYKAATYHSFAALQALVNLSNDYQFVNDFIKLFGLLEASAKIHGTPVFLLCTFACLNLASVHEQNNNEQGKLAALQSALKYLYIAEYAQEFSSTAIHNAYYGLGLAQSNLWGIDNISKMRDKLINETDLENNKEAQMIALQQAKELAASYGYSNTSLEKRFNFGN